MFFFKQGAGNTGCHNGDDDGIDKCVCTVLGKEVGDQSSSKGDPAGNGIALDHIYGCFGQDDSHTGHHSVGNVLTDEVHDFCQKTESSDQGHDHTADENHGASL